MPGPSVLNRRTCRTAAGLIPLILSGCTIMGPAERQSLREASEQYNRGEVPAAVVRLDRLIRDYGSAPEVAEAYYLRGLCRMKMGQVRPAISDFENAVDKSQRDEVTARARASLGTIAFQNSEWGRAADLYAASVNHLPDQPPTDQILYDAGVALQRAGRWKEASFQFARILNRFRDRPIATEARRMAAWRHEYFSIQLAVFANADAAAASVSNFRARGLDAVQENLPRAGGAMWVVMAGRYALFADAVAALPRARQIQPSAFIIP